MSRYLIERRRFLTLSLALLAAPRAAHGAEPPLAPAAKPSAGVPTAADRGADTRAGLEPRRGDYDVNVSILYGAFSFHLSGTIEETIERTAGRYDVVIVGQGRGIANRVESHGVLLDGRWAPMRGVSWFEVAGRESRSETTYDYRRRSVEYHYRGETFLLRRKRVAEDVVAIADGLRLDDMMSAALNYSEERWAPDADGAFRTHVVRRRRPETEGPDDVEKLYRAEIVPMTLIVNFDSRTARSVALFDLTRFSSWARPGHPARIVFGPDRRPELVSSSLILGTSITIQIARVA